MKKIILPVLAMMSLGTATAQFNLGFSAGYGLASPGRILGTTTAPNGDQKNIYGTLGNGIQANVTPGYMFGDHFGVELGLNGFFGSQTTVNKVEAPAGTLTQTEKSTQFRITPAFYIKSGGEKFSVYARTGLLIPLLGSVRTEVNNSTNPAITTMQELKTSGKVAIGYTGAFGLNIHFGEKFGFFAEVGANNLRVKSKATELKTATSNGNDQIEGMSTYAKEVTYVDELTSSSNNFGKNPLGTSSTSAREELRQDRNFSNFFVQVGIKFTFTGD